jgi:hypothetical protein
LFPSTTLPYFQWIGYLSLDQRRRASWHSWQAKTFDGHVNFCFMGNIFRKLIYVWISMWGWDLNLSSVCGTAQIRKIGYLQYLWISTPLQHRLKVRSDAAFRLVLNCCRWPCISIIAIYRVAVNSLLASEVLKRMPSLPCGWFVVCSFDSSENIF